MLKLRKFKKIVKWFFLSLMFLIIAAWIFIETPFGQNWITKQVTRRLSSDLHTKIEINHVSFSLFNKMHLEGVLAEDQQGDTLLYAADVRIRITDWFFFKKNVELKYIGLENAVIKMHRTDSVWNHQFIIDYFSPSSAKKKKEEGGIQLKLKEVELKNVTFVQNDEWRGTNRIASVASLHLDAKDINFSKRLITVNSLSLDSPVWSEYSYNSRRNETKDIKKVFPTRVDSLLQWNTDGWVIQLDKLEIKNGLLKIDKQKDEPLLTSFDGNHVEFGNITGTFTGLRWEKDTITAHIDLKTKERSGFEVKSLVANLKMTPQEMAFSDLGIRTNNSTIRNYFRMSYDDFGDMSDFIHKVRMQGIFENSEIDSDDIAYFAPAMSEWKKKIILKGNVRGTVDDLIGKEMSIQAGNNTSLNGDISLTGLPNINQTFIDFKANDFRTTYQDAVTIVPAIRNVTTPDLRKLGFIRFTGSFTGFIRDFVTFGTIQTNLGTVKSDLNMKLPAGQEPVYSGTISTDLFRLGEFLNDPQIGIIAMNGSVKGKGFNEKNRNADIDGKIHFIDFNSYRYSNIFVKGKLDKKLFDGIASIDDPNAELSMKGLIDFNSNVPIFNFIADVKKAELKKLNLTNDDIAFHGKFNLDFTGDNIDNFLGRASITEASLTRNGNPLPFDSLIISSEYSNNVKILKARSNEFEGSVTGNFTIRDLPDAFTLFLNRYYPAYVRPPKRIPENESFTFDITTQFVDDYIRLADSSLSGFNNSRIYGSLNTSTNEMTLNADIPHFQFKNYNFDNVKMTGRGTRDSLSLSGSVANVSISDSVNIPKAVFHINARNDSSKVTITTSTKQGINQANMNALVLTYNNGAKIEFDRSTFAINGKTWTIDENGELEFREKTPAAGQLVLRESNQEIHVKTKPSAKGNWNDIVVELRKVNIGDFSPLLLPKNRVEGLVSGNLLVENPTDSLVITSNDILTEGFRLDNDSIGNAKVSIVYSGKEKLLKGKVNTTNPEHNIAAEATIYFDPAKQKDNLIQFNATSFELKFLERFLGDLFSDIQGYVTGSFDIRGELDEPHIYGKGRLKDAGLKVNFTQCFYKIRDTDIALSASEISLDGIVLTDPVTGNPIYITGGIEHDAFKDMFFDLSVTTRKPNTKDILNNKPVLLLNTSFNDNKQFYGRVRGTGSFSLSGYQSDMLMKIDAIASDKDSSTITIPPSQSKVSGIADFLTEKKYGREMEENRFTKGATNVKYDVDVTASPKLFVRVILDDLTGDEIKGRGTGNLNIKSGTSEPLTMRGKFDIQQGDYLFTFQSFFNKKFEIKAGAANYIEWTGDPNTAQINFEAVYTAKEVSFSPLAAANYIDQSFVKNRENVFVQVNLTGELFKPKFEFKLDFPANSPTRSDFAVMSTLKQIEKNPNEINRQVTYLIVFNSFAPPENSQGQSSTSSTNLFGEFANSTISSLSGLFFNEINKKLNNELAKILKTDKVSINFSGYVYNRNLLESQSSTVGFNYSNFNVNVPISLFKDRFVVTLGSTLDVPLQSSIQQNVQFLPDVTAEWMINQSGSIRASFFYRQDLDYLTSTSTGGAKNKRSGASIAYRKEFDTLGELFRKKKKQQLQLPPPSTSDTLQTTSSVPLQQ